MTETAGRPPGAGPGARMRRAWLVPALVACLPAVLYLVVEPPTADLAAHVFRAGLSEREGFAVWNNAWYGGHHAVAYSVLFPPLAAALGPALAGALAAVAAAAAFAALVGTTLGRGARPAAVWFALATGAMLFAGRLPFALGVAIGLGALLAHARGRLALAALAAVLTGLASPVATLFLALAWAALAGARVLEDDRRGALTAVGLAGAALLPALLVAGAFPEGGRHVMPLESFVTVLIACAAFAALVPSERRELRVAAALYAAGATLAFALPTPVGNNAARLGALFGGPVLLAALLARPSHLGGRVRAAAAAIALAALAVWQWSAPVRDVAAAEKDPAADAAFHAPLLAFLAPRAGPADRIEIPFTAGHWEAVHVAPRHPLARGWQRQLDRRHNALFYEGPLDHARYEAWLRDTAVRFVALPESELDPSARRERELIEQRPPYLRELAAPPPRWRVFELTPAPRAADFPLSVTAIRAQRVELRAERPGSAVVRVRPSRYWRIRTGCVEPAGDWIRVTVGEPGAHALEIDLAPGRLLSRGRRCG